MRENGPDFLVNEVRRLTTQPPIREFPPPLGTVEYQNWAYRREMARAEADRIRRAARGSYA